MGVDSCGLETIVRHGLVNRTTGTIAIMAVDVKKVLSIPSVRSSGRTS